MSAPIECPICMDSIEISTNCVTTECGHCFHTNCLMKSIAHNGFGCPYCRTKMAEEPEEEEEDEYEEEDEEDEMYENYLLRGFRLFWNNINGEEQDEEDTIDEQEFEELSSADEDEEEDETPIIPSTDYIVEKLRAKHVSYEDLVKALLGCGDHPEYDEYDYRNINNQVFGKIRTIITRYDPPAVNPEEISYENIYREVSNNV